MEKKSKATVKGEALVGQRSKSMRCFEGNGELPGGATLLAELTLVRCKKRR